MTISKWADNEKEDQYYIKIWGWKIGDGKRKGKDKI
jgi:hypothetical protein